MRRPLWDDDPPTCVEFAAGELQQWEADLQPAFGGHTGEGMIEQLDELYREVILDHFKNSSHSGAIAEAQVKADGANPLCGDELSFHLLMNGERIQQVRFNGKGCAISQAAASMLAAQLEGKTMAQATHIIDVMKALMQGQDPDPTVDLGDLEALAGVRKFPVRVKCAALSWNVVEEGLNEYSSQQKLKS